MSYRWILVGSYSTLLQFFICWSNSKMVIDITYGIGTVSDWKGAGSFQAYAQKRLICVVSFLRTILGICQRAHKRHLWLNIFTYLIKFQSNQTQKLSYAQVKGTQKLLRAVLIQCMYSVWWELIYWWICFRKQYKLHKNHGRLG